MTNSTAPIQPDNRDGFHTDQIEASAPADGETGRANKESCSTSDSSFHPNETEHDDSNIVAKPSISDKQPGLGPIPDGHKRSKSEEDYEDMWRTYDLEGTSGGLEGAQFGEIDGDVDVEVSELTFDQALVDMNGLAPPTRVKYIFRGFGEIESDKDGSGKGRKPTTTCSRTMHQRLFKHALRERLLREPDGSYGFIDMFQNLSDIRADIFWAQENTRRHEMQEPYLAWQDNVDTCRPIGWHKPYFTYLFTASSLIMMIVAMQMNDWKVAPWSINPLLGPTPEALLRAGALQARLVIHDNEWYRLFTPIVLHAGFIHLFMNLVVFFYVSVGVEQNHGTLRTAFLFVVSAAGGNVLSAIMQPGYVLVGASGGIFGLIGVCLADVTLNWKLMFVASRFDGLFDPSKYFWGIFWIILELVGNLVIGMTPILDNWSHLFGLFYGFLMGLVVLRRLPLKFFDVPGRYCHKVRVSMYRLLAMLVYSSCLLTSVTLLLRSDGIHAVCWNCRYFTCLPFPFWTEEKWWYCDGCETASGRLVRSEEGGDFEGLKINCPVGDSTVTADITDLNIIGTDDVVGHLRSFCRELC